MIDFSNATSLAGNHFELCVLIEIDADSIEAFIRILTSVVSSL